VLVGTSAANDEGWDTLILGDDYDMSESDIDSHMMTKYCIAANIQD
jgi:hypothetical protein